MNTHGGLEIGPQSVGQGQGETEVTLVVSEEISSGGALELGYEVEVEATGGTILGGFSVGASAENTLTVTSGKETQYPGIVGAINAASFAENRYQFGLFTYAQTDPISGRQFEVVNDWVQ